MHLLFSFVVVSNYKDSEVCGGYSIIKFLEVKPDPGTHF